MDNRTLPQRATGFLKVAFYNTNHDPEPPMQAKYRIDDISSGVAVEVRPDTYFTVPLDGIAEIKIEMTDTDMINPDNFIEYRRLSVVGYFNQNSDEVPGTYDFNISRVLIPQGIP